MLYELGQREVTEVAGVPPSEAERYWKIAPPIEAENVVALR